MKQKIKGWLKRYLPAEIVGTVTAVGAATITHALYKNPIFMAYAGSLGETIGFYSTVFIQSILTENKKHKIEKRKLLFFDLYKIITNIVLEFGLAGIIDGLLLRPFFLYLFPILLKNSTVGILIGKIVGDFTFYILVILIYEITNKQKSKNQKCI
jgi:hypothetical protein